ncbi:12883_t:CDS:2 [Ambispora leptoticha]|uniref:12883_t:CDS:1 n=1 Tax=Ambispora leptoticha TaxID=144679 RepID=A0A9N8W0Y7_9GLOM|nr:12883_t:CDS:2 [Ambispora leptoticha]
MAQGTIKYSFKKISIAMRMRIDGTRLAIMTKVQEINDILRQHLNQIAEWIKNFRTTQFCKHSNDSKHVLDQVSKNRKAPYGASVIVPNEIDRVSLIELREENDLYLFPRNPNGMITQNPERWGLGNCAETNPWTQLAQLRSNIPIRTRTINIQTKKKDIALFKLQDLPDYLQE